MFVVFLMNAALVVLFLMGIAFIATQIIIPVWKGTSLFPLFNPKIQRARAQVNEILTDEEEWQVTRRMVDDDPTSKH